MLVTPPGEAGPRDEFPPKPAAVSGTYVPIGQRFKEQRVASYCPAVCPLQLGSVTTPRLLRREKPWKVLSRVLLNLGQIESFLLPNRLKITFIKIL